MYIKTLSRIEITNPYLEGERGGGAQENPRNNYSAISGTGCRQFLANVAGQADDSLLPGARSMGTFASEIRTRKREKDRCQERGRC